MSKKMNPCEELANAIVLQAVKDYRDANKKLSKGRKNQEAQSVKDECIRFFQSKWFSVLTDLDSEFLIERLNEEVKA